MPKGERLSPRQIQGIAALMQSRSIEQAAKAVGVSKRCMLRWLTVPMFQAALHQAGQDLIAQAVRRLSDLSGKAIDTLAAEMQNADAAPGTRVRAADVVLSRLMNLKELSDLEARVAKLEENQDERGNPQTS
jgi:transposase